MNAEHRQFIERPRWILGMLVLTTCLAVPNSCIADDGSDCATCEKSCQSSFLFWKPHQRPIGRTSNPCLPRGTTCSCGPQGGFYGYYPTCWTRWPREWEPCQVNDWETALRQQPVKPRPADPLNPMPSGGDETPCPVKAQR